VLSWCALALGADLTWQSPSQPVVVDVTAPVFNGPLVDTGWWPSASDPLAVRFHITPSGDLTVDADATSELAWPDPLWQRVVAAPGRSIWALEAALEMSAEVQIDIGIYTGVLDVWSEDAVLRGAQTFDGLLLRGHPTERVDVTVADPNMVDPYEFAVSLITGVELVFALETYPQLVAGLEGGHVDGAFGPHTTAQEDDGAWDDLPIEGAPSVDGELVWTALLDGSLDVVFEPQLVVDTWIGDWELLALPLPVRVVTLDALIASAPMGVAHPLPSLSPPPAAHDFGQVAVGDEAVAWVALPNLGADWLVGEATVEGDPAFALFSGDVAAAAGGSDGLAVTFSPGSPRLHEGELVIATNDPAHPEVRVALTGLAADATGPAPTTPTDDADPTDVAASGDGEGVKTGGCGCDGSGAAGGTVALVALGLVARRRRVSAPAA
jgi:hypothetical protein